MKRTQRIMQAVGEAVLPEESWYSFEMPIADAEGFNVRRRQYRSIRFGEDVEVRRSHQAVACMKRCTQELGRPIWLLGVIRYGDIDARRGNPVRTMRKPK